MVYPEEMKKSWLTDKEYSRVFSQVPRVAVDLVLETDSGLLLSLRKIAPYKGYWHFPGGGVGFRESLFSATQRIAREELGLSVRPVTILGTMEFLKEVQNGESRHTVSTAIAVEPLSKNVVLDHQASAVRFFKKLPKKMVPGHRQLLKEIGWRA